MQIFICSLVCLFSQWMLLKCKILNINFHFDIVHMFVDTKASCFFFCPANMRKNGTSVRTKPRNCANIPEAFLLSGTFTVCWNYFEREREPKKTALPELLAELKKCKNKIIFIIFAFFLLPRTIVMKYNAWEMKKDARAQPLLHFIKIRFAYKVLSRAFAYHDCAVNTDT